MEEIEDYRECPRYKISEIIFAALVMHIFKSKSRNDFNNLKDKLKFEANYKRAFNMDLPHMDTVDLMLRNIPPEELEKLKTYFVRTLIERKIFYKYKILNRNYNISIDATGLMTIGEANKKFFPNSVYRIYKKETEEENRVHLIYVLEAKLVCRNGFCISLGTEWIENQEEEFKKQDCELRAFTRLASKLKKEYPRLPICIVGDGLYPNQNIFKICEDNQWDWIFTFKDGSLKSVWKEIGARIAESDFGQLATTRTERIKDAGHQLFFVEIIETYCWVNSISFGGHVFNFVSLSYEEHGKSHKFVYITNLEVNSQNIEEIIQNGRLRFKIENEGFNCQKNNGYYISHKYSRTSEFAMKNYYTCAQIGHIINQLFELQKKVKEKIQGRKTMFSLWESIRGLFSFFDVIDLDFEKFITTRRQIQYE